MKRVRRNVASLFVSEIARRILGFFSVAYMARVLGVEGFGMVMVGLSVLSYVVLTGSGGLHVFGTRNVAREVDSLDPGAVLGARLMNTVVVLAVALVLTITWVRPAELATVIFITACSGLLQALFLDWYFQGRELMSETAIARTTGAALYLTFLLVAVRSVDDLWLAAVAAIVGDVGSTGYLLIRYRRSVGLLRVSIDSWRSLMRSAWPFGAGSVLAHLSVNFPVLAIAALLGSVEAGIFSGANKLVFFILMVDRILGTMLLPVSARLHQEEGDRLSNALNEALRWIILIGLPLCIGGAFLAGPIVALVFGASYEASGDVFRVLVWFALLTMIHTVYTSGVLATGGEKKYRNVMAVSACLYVAGVVGGVLIGGVMGAAAGMLLAEGVTVILMQQAARTDLPILRPSGLGRVVTAGIVLAVGLLVLPPFHVLITIAIGAAVYGATIFIVRAVTFEELRQMIQRPA